MPYRCAVIGHPVSHSLSPELHQYFASISNIDLSYERIDCPSEQLATTLSQFLDNSGLGLSVTTPLKKLAYEQCSTLNDTAIAAGVVNTLCWRDNAWHGHNTDGLGLVSDFKRHNIHPTQQHIMILGTGGATLGIIPSLKHLQPKQITIVTRSPSSINLIDNCHVVDYTTANHLLTTRNVQLLINATPCSLQRQLPPLTPNCTLENTLCYDLAYHHDRDLTSFQQWAIDNGSKLSCDGIGMLIEQAAYQFQWWFDLYKPPDTTILQKKYGQTQQLNCIVTPSPSTY